MPPATATRPGRRWPPSLLAEHAPPPVTAACRRKAVARYVREWKAGTNFLLSPRYQVAEEES